jgi:hypothetical protein
VRLFLNFGIHDPRSRYQGQHFAQDLSHILEGGIYMGHPKFGEYKILSGGWGKTTTGHELPYLDLYPEERFEFQDEKKPQRTQTQICEDILQDRRLLTQFECWGVIEIQTSTGLAINFEAPRPIIKMEAQPVQRISLTSPVPDMKVS